jgi:NTE family protein
VQSQPTELTASRDPGTNYFFLENREALVLGGGGARCAYQVGVLRALAEWLPAEAACPFEVLVGTSAGAINAAVLGSGADRMRDAVDRLLRVWSGLHVDQVVRTGTASMLRAGLHWLLSLVSGGFLLPPPRSLLDTGPLRELLGREVDFDRIDRNLQSGPLHAVAVGATSYTTGRSVTFFEGRPSMQEWRRFRRDGVKRKLGIDELMASSAIPFMFPSAPIGDEYFGDGAMRQLAPLSPAVHLCANRLLVVGTRGEASAQPSPSGSPEPPSPGHMLGFVLDSLFADGLSMDLERLRQINALLVTGEEGARSGYRPIEALVIQPSVDPTALARRHVAALPASLRTLLRTMGALEARGGLLVSYLLFESAYTQELMDLGYRDAQARRTEILEFIREG